MAITTAAGVAYDTVTNESGAGLDDASQLAPLGFQLVVPTANNGDQIWTYVKAAGALGVGEICQLVNAAAQTEVQPTAVATLVQKAGIVGVAQHAIGDNGFGFILTKGRGNIRAGSAPIGADRAVTPGGAGGGNLGRGLDFAAGNVAPGCIIAWCSVTGLATAQSTCWIDCGGT